MEKFVNLLKSKIIQNKYLLFISLFYFVFRLIYLDKLPIFNDESIYLEWGYREIHNPGYLYYSLYDSKQPFLMWIFGIMQDFFQNPLYAGRLVSVFTGFLTLLGLYKLGSYLFDKKVGIIASLLYVVIPLFSFYDRQALMESSLAAVGVWAGFCMLKFFENKSQKYAVFLGIILGVGFFIKSTAFIFLISYIFSFFIVFYFSKKKGKLFENFFWSIGVFLISVALLLINPEFWNTLNTNSRYSLTLNELLMFPIGSFLKSLLTNLGISFLHLTPFIFLLSILGIYAILKRNRKITLVFLFFYFFSILITTILVRIPADRYLVSFLPFLLIPASFFIHKAYQKNKVISFILITIVFLIAFFMTLAQTLLPAEYIKLTGKYTSFSNRAYINGFTSGYGINEAVSFLKEKAKNEKIIIGVAENTGNPESAMFIYFSKNENVKVVFLDKNLLTENINQYDCLYTSAPVYFVSRDNQQGGLERYFEKLKTFKNPYGTNSVGIYTFKKDCKGESVELQLELAP